KEEYRDMSGTLGQAAPSTLPYAAEEVDTKAPLRKRMEVELTRKRQESMESVPGKERELPPASVVDLEKAKAAEEKRKEIVEAGEAAPPAGLHQGETIEPEGGRKAPTEEEMAALLEARFKKGLLAYDIVERDWTFRYA